MSENKIEKDFDDAVTELEQLHDNRFENILNEAKRVQSERQNRVETNSVPSFERIFANQTIDPDQKEFVFKMISEHFTPPPNEEHWNLLIWLKGMSRSPLASQWQIEALNELKKNEQRQITNEKKE